MNDESVSDSYYAKLYHDAYNGFIDAVEERKSRAKKAINQRRCDRIIRYFKWFHDIGFRHGRMVRDCEMQEMPRRKRYHHGYLLGFNHGSWWQLQHNNYEFEKAKQARELKENKLYQIMTSPLVKHTTLIHPTDRRKDLHFVNTTPRRNDDG